MKTLSNYLKYYKKQCILSPLFKFAESGMELLVPVVIASLIDKGISVGNKTYAWQMGGLLLLFAVLGLIFAITAQYFAAYAAVGSAKRIRRDLFIHIQGFSYSTLDSLGSSTLITRMTSDVNQVQSGINLTLRLLLRSPFIVFGSLIAAFILDVKTAIVFSISIPLLALAVFAVTYFTIPLYKKVQAKLDVVLNSVKNGLTGVRVIRAFGREKDELNEFREKNSSLTADQNKVGKISAILNPLTYLIVNLAIVLIIKIGGDRIYKGEMSQGKLVALYGYMSQILIELIKLANLIINISKTVACTRRIQAIFDIPEEDTAPVKCEDKGKAFLQFDNVSLKYENASANAVENLSFEINEGETLGIIGGTGSGKTTVLNMIPLFYHPTEGKIFLDETNVLSLSKDELRARIAIVPQKATLVKGSIRENLKWGNERATDEELWQALEYAQCKEFVENKQGGLDYQITQNGTNLSGGQRQRLTIARALVKRPEILILDDSSSALDYATDAKLRKALKNLPFNPTIVISSQRTNAVMHSDKILVLDDGKQVGLGTHDELIKNCKVYQNIYESQFKRMGNS